MLPVIYDSAHEVSSPLPADFHADQTTARGMHYVNRFELPFHRKCAT